MHRPPQDPPALSRPPRNRHSPDSPNHDLYVFELAATWPELVHTRNCDGRFLAEGVAYLGLELGDKGELLADVDRESISPDRDYLRRARDVSREQVALAGKRLAAVTMN